MSMNKKSTKTTFAGIAAALALILAGLAAMFDADPSTTANMAKMLQGVLFIAAALGIGFGGVSARDDDVTSEGRKAPKAK